MKWRNMTLLMFITTMLVTSISGCLFEDEKPKKTYTYEIYRRNPDGKYTKWVSGNKPSVHGTYISWTNKDGGEITVSDNLTIIPILVSEASDDKTTH